MANALLLTYHIFEGVRRGGIHYIANYLSKIGYNIDFVTNPVYIKWLFKYGLNDRENVKNLFRLIKGIRYDVFDGVEIRNFSIPILIPYKLASFINNKFKNFGLVSNWCLLEKRLRSSYNIIVIESTSSILLLKKLRERYPKSKIIYRPSDPVMAYSDIKLLINAEKDIIQSADRIWLVNESAKSFYEKKLKIRLKNYFILNNPVVYGKEINEKNINISNRGIKAVYVGCFPIDYDLIDMSSEKYKSAEFIIIGPYKDKLKKNNVIFTGPLNRERCKEIIRGCNIGIIPYKKRREINQLFEITGKVGIFMLYGLPIVGMNISETLAKLKGFYVAKNHDEFLNYFSDAIMLNEIERVKIFAAYKEILNNYTFEKFEYDLDLELKNIHI